MKRVLQRMFAADGPLAAAVSGFKLRTEQLEMSEAIGEAIESTGILVAEAGTGTGKTFAYWCRRCLPAAR
jgi:ATP-dependent DNA helicase DinG